MLKMGEHVKSCGIDFEIRCIVDDVAIAYGLDAKGHIIQRRFNTRTKTPIILGV